MTGQSIVRSIRSRTFELIAVFLGVALAFFAEDWREQRAERREERTVLSSLRDELLANRTDIDQRLSFQQRAETATAAMLSLLESAEDGTEVLVPDSLLVGFLTSATYEPARGAIDALLEGGQLNLVEDAELRSRIAAWPARYEDANRLQMLQRDMVHSVLSPALVDSGVDLGKHWPANRPALRGEIPEDLKSSSTLVPSTGNVRSVVGQRFHIARQVMAVLRNLGNYDLELIELVNRSLATE